MKTLILFCAFGLFALLLTGCDHLAADGNLGRYYEPYAGIQTNWPTSSGGGFVTIANGFTVYHGFPPTPYTVVGRFSVPNIPLYRLAACARYHHANTIFLLEQSYDSVGTDPGMIFFNAHVAVNMPGSTHMSHHTEATAYLANTNAIPTTSSLAK